MGGKSVFKRLMSAITDLYFIWEDILSARKCETLPH